MKIGGVDISDNGRDRSLLFAPVFVGDPLRSRSEYGFASFPLTYLLTVCDQSCRYV